MYKKKKKDEPEIQKPEKEKEVGGRSISKYVVIHYTHEGLDILISNGLNLQQIWRFYELISLQ